MPPLSGHTCVKEGAVLCCLLFNIMIDDPVLWDTGCNILPLEDALNNPLLNLAIWANTNKMAVSVEKTVSQLFLLSTKQHLFHLEYKRLPLKHVHFSKYLGIDLDSHVGIPGNDTADQRAKKGAESTQPEIPLILERAKSIISTHIDHSAAMPEWMATT
ncbi:hypothetical protein TNCV_1022781 [Trichonephila clavipes]|nr:hypothetical protein TNCV_1022781 [Trichonephila clavipes]